MLGLCTSPEASKLAKLAERLAVGSRKHDELEVFGRRRWSRGVIHTPLIMHELAGRYTRDGGFSG
jgi:hypothetical protein